MYSIATCTQHLTRQRSEQDLQRQLALTKNQLRDLRMSHDSNQAKLLDHTQRQGTQACTLIPSTTLTAVADQEVVSKLAELDMMVADLEHANSRVATVERRNVRTLFSVKLYIEFMRRIRSSCGLRLRR